MSKPISISDMALEILRTTHDGNDLAPEHLKLLESAVNGFLNERGEAAFQSLYKNVKSGYVKPWFHGIEGLTIDHDGYVYWRGRHVEHYSRPWAYTDGAKRQAEVLASRCRRLESIGAEVSVRTAVLEWED